MPAPVKDWEIENRVTLRLISAGIFWDIFSFETQGMKMAPDLLNVRGRLSSFLAMATVLLEDWLTHNVDVSGAILDDRQSAVLFRGCGLVGTHIHVGAARRVG